MATRNRRTAADAAANRTEHIAANAVEAQLQALCSENDFAGGLTVLDTYPEIRTRKLSLFELDVRDWGYVYGLAFGLALGGNPEMAHERAANSRLHASAQCKRQMGRRYRGPRREAGKRDPGPRAALPRRRANTDDRGCGAARAARRNRGRRRVGEGVMAATIPIDPEELERQQRDPAAYEAVRRLQDAYDDLRAGLDEQVNATGVLFSAMHEPYRARWRRRAPPCRPRNGSARRASGSRVRKHRGPRPLPAPTSCCASGRRDGRSTT